MNNNICIIEHNKSSRGLANRRAMLVGGNETRYFAIGARTTSQQLKEHLEAVLGGKWLVTLW